MYELEAGGGPAPGRAARTTRTRSGLIVLRGRPTLRTPEGEQELEEGKDRCASDAAGKGCIRSGTATDEPIRVLMLSTLVAPDVVEYPDSGKVSVVDANGERLFRAFRGPDADYWDGE